ncbi:MAG: hypothetical protein WCI96_06815 [Planctomycetota bacterium]
MTSMQAISLVFAALCGFGLLPVCGCKGSQSLAGAEMPGSSAPASADTGARRSDLPSDSKTSVLVAEIATKVADNLAAAAAMKIHSSQTVTFAREPLEGLSEEECELRIREPQLAVEALPHIRIEAEVDAEMTPTSLRASFRKIGSAQPEMILELSTVDGKPMFQESHWYAALKGYLRGDRYAIEDPSGVEVLRVDHTLWSEIQAQGAPVCALAEFYCTWIGKESIRVRANREIIGEAIAISCERRNGEDVYVLSRPCYDLRKDTSRSIRSDRFVVSKDFRLVAWRTSYTSLRPGARVSYMVVDRAYTYRNVNEP